MVEKSQNDLVRVRITTGGRVDGYAGVPLLNFTENVSQPLQRALCEPRAKLLPARFKIVEICQRCHQPVGAIHLADCDAPTGEASAHDAAQFAAQARTWSGQDAERAQQLQQAPQDELPQQVPELLGQSAENAPGGEDSDPEQTPLPAPAPPVAELAKPEQHIEPSASISSAPSRPGGRKRH